MAGFRRIEIIDDLSPSFFITEAPIIASKTLALSCEPRHRLSYELDLFRHSPLLSPATPCEFFDAVTADLIPYEQQPPLYDPFPFARFERRVAESHRLRDLSDRVSLLEFGFDRLLSDRSADNRGVDRKYKWTAEIKSPEEDGFHRKYKWSAEVKGEAAKSQSQSQQQRQKASKAKNYKWTAEMKGGKIQRTEAVEVKDRSGRVRNYKWSSEIKGKGGEDIPIQRTYTFQASTGGDRTGADKKEKKGREEKKEKKKDEGDTRVVEIEDSPDQRALVLRQAFARRTRADLKRLGKRKELSPQDAAMVIQVTFRAYLIRRSQALRALRELAVAKAKLKEIRALFHNFSYRSSVAQDAAERQRFTERIIVLLLTVDSIEGADIMVRSSKRSMVDELEAMLDVVDPHPHRSLSMRRRTFDMPNGVVEKEMAAGVANVVQLVEQDENGSATFEACL